jgi:MinD-like ATPase involved in chromosome partitioning or flagellar assembly
MDEKNRLKNKELAIQLLTEKTNLKQNLYRIVKNVFDELKEVIEEVADEINEALHNVNENVYLKYEDKGSFEAQLQIGGDILIFKHRMKPSKLIEEILRRNLKYEIVKENENDFEMKVFI